MVDISSRNKRGEFEIRLTSPSGTESKLLALRPLDNSISGFSNFRTWPLMSTHYWGEQTKGRWWWPANQNDYFMSKTHQMKLRWSLEVKNSGGRTAYVRGWRIVLYGTEENHNEETSWSLKSHRTDQTDRPLPENWNQDIVRFPNPLLYVEESDLNQDTTA